MTDRIEPLVSISCITYNHEDYIADAFDGFLLQKTNFPIEILIHDDASTDKTPEIIRQYCSKYPQLIKPIYQTENQHSQGIRPGPRINYPRALGKYIALCEGDDFWTDPLKLQKQVDYLEANPAVFLCGHAVKQIDANGNTLTDSKFDIREDLYFDQDYVAFGKVAFPTLSVMFRNSVRIPNFSLVNGDTFTFAYFSNFGDAFISREVMGAHRVHAAGLWSSLDDQSKYDAILRTYARIPAVIASQRKSLSYLRYYFVALQDYNFWRKIRIAPIALFMTVLWLRPTSARFIFKRLISRFS